MFAKSRFQFYDHNKQLNLQGDKVQFYSRSTIQFDSTDPSCSLTKTEALDALNKNFAKLQGTRGVKPISSYGISASIIALMIFIVPLIYLIAAIVIHNVVGGKIPVLLLFGVLIMQIFIVSSYSLLKKYQDIWESEKFSIIYNYEAFNNCIGPLAEINIDFTNDEFQQISALISASFNLLYTIALYQWILTIGVSAKCCRVRKHRNDYYTPPLLAPTVVV